MGAPAACLPGSVRAMRWRLASFGLAFLAMAAVAIAVRADGPAQPLAAPTATVAPDVAPTSPSIPRVALGRYLEGGGTYAFPGGVWIFDVPEGMQLQHHWRASGGSATSYGFLNQATGASFSFNVKPDSAEFQLQAQATIPAARELASVWLDAVEASVRRPPGFVEPPPAPVAGPGANPDGVPYLRRSYLHDEVFEGGRTYATPDDKWLVDVPTGINVRFHENTQVVPTCLPPSTAAQCEPVDTYLFDAVGIRSSVYISKTTGKVAGRFGDVNSQMDALAASFKSVRAMRWRRASFGLAFLAMGAVAVAITVRASELAGRSGDVNSQMDALAASFRKP